MDHPDTDTLRALAERVYPHLGTYRIGSRVTLDGDPTGSLHTLVALRVDRVVGAVFPWYVDDEYVAGTISSFGLLDPGDLEDIVPAPDDADKARAARAWAADNREFLTQHGHCDVLFDLPGDAEQLLRFFQFGVADRDWRIAEEDRRRAHERREMAIARIEWAQGSESSPAAGLLGLTEADVSRAEAASVSGVP
ncbi:hypothetical protein [Streptomyces acidiscabies]|uniref:Uncharacterized protein n=1 Tax=Streptomyces acidiscabies TaxID=42234 RepID=A0ABU4MEW5_9ACTN|nr:hypothetical protein [Streptomyces acidiscabies]MDX3025650.1 hypothetical protein [Streptomyces acidiscabies]